MFKKILVAVDISEMSKNIFAKALSLAKMNNASLIILHVLSPEEENTPMPVPIEAIDMYPYPETRSDLTMEMWRQRWEEFQREAIELLKSFGEEAARAGVAAECKQVSGSPGKKICQFALEWETDLIIVGRRGRSGLKEMILGSVSNYVLHRAPCSVLIVQ